MLQGQSKGALPVELSYEDFLETYGRSKSIESDSHSEVTDESFESAEPVDNSSTSTGSFTTIIEDLQVTDFDSIDNFNKSAEFNRETKQFEDCNTSDSDMNFTSCTSGTESKRRNSRFQTMANRLARKSFRAMKKKVSSDGPGFSHRDRSQFVASNSKWNSMFKRSRSSPRAETEESKVQSNATAAKHHECNHEQEVMTSSNSSRPIFARSLSHSHAESIRNNSPNFAATKRHSIGNDDSETRPKLNKKFEVMKHKYNKSYSTVGCRNPAARPTVLPFSANSAPQPFSPEYDVVRKCDGFREEEHTRLVAIATLLKRRRNSLKIKCDQFTKELAQKNVEEDKARLIQCRLRQMRKKLQVVDQCIEEQREEMKTTSAKVELLLNLEFYKLDLAREEKYGFSASAKTRRLRSGSKSPFPISASCETLSVGDPYIFDDASSITSSHKKINSTQSSPARYNRRCSASSGIQNNRLQSHGVEYQVDELVRKSTNRSFSIDNTVTSDCDSGFDNGDGLSRSDISLNRSLSKSTGSITSVSSHGNHPRSASCQESCSNSSGNCFFPAKLHSSSELSLFSPKASISSTSNKSRKIGKVDPSVLAAIEDFEKFAEKTKRRLSLNGKLVPLKKGL